MEENNRGLRSIWGKWWERIRKWFYPAWLGYEASTRFYDYSLSIHNYFIKRKSYLASYIGEIGTQTLDIFSTVGTFVICTFFLTVPTCFLLYKFFKTENLTSTQLESKLKPIF